MCDTKTCPKCKEEKPATLEFFHRNRKSKSGLQSHCKVCVAKSDKERYDKEKRRAGVYFIANGPYVKIGVTRHLTGRFKVVKTCNANEVSLLYFIDGADEEDEHLFHLIFAHRHHRGEWYYFGPNDSTHATNTEVKHESNDDTGRPSRQLTDVRREDRGRGPRDEVSGVQRVRVHANGVGHSQLALPLTTGESDSGLAQVD